MEYLIEAILDLILEGSIEISKNKKVPKWIRYPLIVLLCLFFMIVILGLLILGIYFLDKNIFIGLLFMLISIILGIGIFIKFRKEYKEKKNE